MTNTFPYASLWHYLEEKGILENGTHEEIQKEKKKYWKNYRRHYQRSYRKTFREVTTRFTPDEYKAIGVQATALGISVPAFINTSALRDVYELDIGTSNEVKLNLSLIQSDIENLIRNHIEHGGELHELYQKLLTRVQAIEEGL